MPPQWMLPVLGVFPEKVAEDFYKLNDPEEIQATARFIARKIVAILNLGSTGLRLNLAEVHRSALWF